MKGPSPDRTISAIDVFCGVGGLTHGLMRGGIDVKAGVDLDPDCRYPYEKNNQAIFLERDITLLSADEVRELLAGSSSLTLLAGCAPCQPFSTYSRSRRAQEHSTDWQLVCNFGGLVRDLQPDLVTMENVAQLADHSVFGEFRAYLHGYDVRWSVVDCALIGVPQTRRRLVLLASKLGSKGLELVCDKVDPPSVRQAIEGLPALQAGGCDPQDRLHASSHLSPLNIKRIRASSPGGTWRDWEPELRASCHRKASGATYPGVYGRMEWDRPAPTITTQCFGYGNGRFGHPDQDRAISLREAAMLQTFPRDYDFVSTDVTVRFSKLGRLIGNAVPVRLGEVIAKTLKDHVEIMS